MEHILNLIFQHTNLTPRTGDLPYVLFSKVGLKVKYDF